MQIYDAKFLKSSAKVSQCPKNDLPEYAFIGRSNVGKSSLINMITNNKNLAKTSGTPGKTQLINHFIIDNNWYIVDLPGYGFAKISKTIRAKWEVMIINYLTQRKSLICTFVLIDIRLKPQSIDLEFLEWLAEKDIAFIIVFTKSDKLKKAQLLKNITDYRDALLSFWEELPLSIISSAISKSGKKEILEFIAQTK
ncbi:MAG: YihA family ribosome biogenesis GTP-binding protein [Bacteroidales bacterium]|nr:YihA family ribosome biogenesis GTP-binding protein [Bacteroidales bacterium]